MASVTDQATDPAGLDEGDSNRDGEKGSDSGHILKTDMSFTLRTDMSS